jgi:hypothetical protein
MTDVDDQIPQEQDQAQAQLEGHLQAPEANMTEDETQRADGE